MVDPADLKVEPLRNSRPRQGGQQVYPSPEDSGVRVTHIPSGTVVEVMIDTSQMANRHRAMAGIEAILNGLWSRG